MAAKSQLDAAGRARKGRLIGICIAFFSFPIFSFAQGSGADTNRLVAAQSAFDVGRWKEAVELSSGPADQPAELDFLRGLAYSRLEKWEEAKSAFETGARKAPTDSRFPIELAGIAYKQRDFRTAKDRLRTGLLLNPRDAYAREFLATVYFLEGNLEAALKYWNPEGKPRLRSVSFSPALQLDEPLRDRALAFNAPQVLTSNALLATETRLDNLGIFSSQRIELTPIDTTDYDVNLHLAEKNGWGDSKIEGIVSFLSGLPYETIYPEFYNLQNRAMNLRSLARWDSQKRRVFVDFSMPFRGDPGLRFRLYADARNENWNLSQTFFGATKLDGINLRRIVAGGEIHGVANGGWSWSAGAEIANRSFRNVPTISSSAERSFFTGNTSLSGWLGLERSLLRVPERRFSLDSSAEAKAGRELASGLGPFVTLRSSLSAQWFPRATGDDYEMDARVRVGAIAGKTTLDELFQLGVERDNDLWLRGQSGTLDGQKGAAPLGRRFFLANWEMDKNVYRSSFFAIKLGPFLDNGAIADSSGAFGSRQWLWNAGLQCKVRILGGLTAVFTYGRNLRGGKGVFYGTVLNSSTDFHR
jgi:tetratricopeptide (TPR) repeat protein